MKRWGFVLVTLVGACGTNGSADSGVDVRVIDDANGSDAIDRVDTGSPSDANDRMDEGPSPDVVTDSGTVTDGSNPTDAGSSAGLPAAGWFPFTGGPWRQDITGAPIDSHSDALIQVIATNGGSGYPNLVGTGTDRDSYGEPIYWGSNTDPAFDLSTGTGCADKPEFAEVHIPANAYIPSNADSFFTIYNRDRNLVFHVTETTVTYAGNTLTGFTAYRCDAVWHLDPTNGADRRLAGSDCTQSAFPQSGCYGHRGFATPAYPIRYDEVTDASVTAIRHPFKLTLTATGCALGLPESVYPLVNGEGCNGGPPEGTRLRLSAAVDCAALYSDHPRRIVCEAFQHYGLVIGDQGGNNIKVENLAAEMAHGDRTGVSWSGVLAGSSFSALTWDRWEVVQLGWQP